MKVALIGCAKSKRNGTCAVRDLYTSTRFRMTLTYALATYDRVYVLSAKHGLLSLDDRIRTYDMTLLTMTQAQRLAWSKRVIAQIRRHLPAGSRVDLYCGRLYREHLPSAGREYRFYAPLRGLPMGLQMAWLSKKLKTV